MAFERAFKNGDQLIIHTPCGDKVTIKCTPDPQQEGRCPTHEYIIEGAELVIHQKPDGSRKLLET